MVNSLLTDQLFYGTRAHSAETIQTPIRIKPKKQLNPKSIPKIPLKPAVSLKTKPDDIDPDQSSSIDILEGNKKRSSLKLSKKMVYKVVKRAREKNKV